MTETIGTAALVKDFKRARAAGVPILAIDTVDQGALIRVLTEPSVAAALDPATGKPKKAEPPILVWEAVHGMFGKNKAGAAALAKATPNPMATIPFVEALIASKKLGEDAIVFMLNAHRQLTDAQPIQAVWNLRDEFKANGRMLVLVAPQWRLPEELKHDVIVLSDPLPDRVQLGKVIAEQYANLEKPAPEGVIKEKEIDALEGLGPFEAETYAAYTMTRAGLDLPVAWDRKCKAVAAGSDGGLVIGQTPIRFADIGGNAAIKEFGQSVIDARWYKLVWFIDEIEKDMAAMHTDTSGTSQYQHKAILTFTQKHKVPALLLNGQPGSGKTLFAHALAGEAGVPLAEMNLGGLKGKHVGDTEGNTNRALDTLLALSQGELLLVATCNDMGSLSQSPELLRRFKLPKWYFDLPTDEERDMIWPISGARYGVDVSKANRPDDHDWTGSEIDAVCELAARLKKTVKEAAQWVVPMAVSSASLVERRREQADGKYLSASYPGTYQKNRDVAAAPARSRKIAVAH